ncbi:MAG TPA: OsmC family protein [Cytophagaceae bacterium]|jgi:organic hydroperoxide reductase OsmC/OhrA
MNDILDEYFYEVDLSLNSSRKGLLTSHGLEKIDVLSSVESPSNNKMMWTPEHLLAASLSSCYMATYLKVAAETNLEVLAYHSQCFVKLEKRKGRFVTTEILLRPTIKLLDSTAMPRAIRCIDEAERLSPIKNGLTIPIEVHPRFEYLQKEVKISA